MPAVIGSNQAARIANLARQKVMEKMLAKVGRNPRPFINFLDSRKRSTQFTGDGIMVGIKEIATNINAQKWSGTPTLQNANGIQNTMFAQFKSSNMFANTQWGYDDLRKASGVTIQPNQNGSSSADARQYARDASSERVLYNRITEDMESFSDRTEQLRDLEAHRPGATADDLVGLMGIMPMSMTGQFGGIDRASNPAVQHVLFAGAVTEQSGVPWIGARGTTGSSGTLLSQLEKFIRALRTAAFACGLPKGRWKLLGGSGFFDKLKAQLRLEKVAFNIDASSGESKLNLLITDERLGLSSPDPRPDGPRFRLRDRPRAEPGHRDLLGRYLRVRRLGRSGDHRQRPQRRSDRPPRQGLRHRHRWRRPGQAVHHRSRCGLRHRPDRHPRQRGRRHRRQRQPGQDLLDLQRRSLHHRPQR
jgi:hypothetical protein